ncbi:hypothetical protein HK101_004220 [Irineochytrium annulatum]|nr:hypothetical protein HK101_004220 [Irineochytrium annulatum]
MKGEPEAYAQLMSQYRGMALAVAYNRLGDTFWAEDVVQEAFTEAFGNLSKLEDFETFPGWFKHTMIPVQELEHVFQEEDQAHNPEKQAVQNEMNLQDMGDAEERKNRASVLERQLGIPQTEYLQIEELERKLHSFQQYKEIVLWFEYDLYDQTMLSYLLHYFNGQALQNTKLNLLCIDSYPEIEHFRGLGQLTSSQIERQILLPYPSQKLPLRRICPVYRRYPMVLESLNRRPWRPLERE